MQTMHQVYTVQGENGIGAYLKVAKASRGGDVDRNELETEANIYDLLKKLDLPGIPCANTLTVSNWAVLGTSAVPGESYDKLFRKVSEEQGTDSLIYGNDFTEFLTRSAEISARGTPFVTNGNFKTLFGHFNKSEYEFLVGRRTLGGLEKSGIEISDLKPLLECLAPDMTDPNTQHLYIDPNPNNGILHPNYGMVAIDPGTSKIDPDGMKLVALLQTPGTGFDSITEDHMRTAVENWRLISKNYGATVLDQSSAWTEFLQSVVVKNASGVASRLSHIQSNKAAIEAGGEKGGLAKKLLPKNKEGLNFHLDKLILGLNWLDKFYEELNLNSQRQRAIQTFSGLL
jgi:hypothetical protein